MREYTTRAQALEFYRDSFASAKTDEERLLVREKIGRHDLYFLGTCILDRGHDFTFGSDKRCEWIFQRCREVQLSPNGYLDLWARGHYKTSIITQLLTVQDILNDPEVTIGLFSFNNTSAKKPYIVIKLYLEYLGKVGLYQDVLYEDPMNAKDKWDRKVTWTIDEGLTVKREGTPRDPTLSSHGLTDSMPTGSHFKIRIYDDVITERHVTNPEMIKKANENWELSLDLTSELPVKHYGHGDISRYVGTRYHFNDCYKTIIDRDVATVRLKPATKDGTPSGKPVFLTAVELDKKRREKGPYVFACQQLLNPVADEAQGFKREWVQYYNQQTERRWWSNMNLYLMCDPAGEKKRENDYTVMAVVGLNADGCYYLIDAIRDRMNLAERTRKLFDFHRQYKPLRVGYEKYGKDSDIEHIKHMQNAENYRFKIVPLGGTIPKNDRIRKLIPVFEAGRFMVPPFLYFMDLENKQRDFMREFLDEEFDAFPVGVHDDMLDCISRIMHEQDTPETWKPVFPQERNVGEDFSTQQMDTRAGGYHPLKYTYAK